MSQLIDLMPESCRKRLGQKRQRRHWALAYISTALVIALTSALLNVAERARAADVQALRTRVDFDTEQRRQALELQESIKALQTRLDRYERLAWPVDLSDVIAIVGDLAPESITLTSISLTPRQERIQAGAVPRGDRQQVRTTRLVIEISGVAPDDVHVANFVSGLDQHPLFGMVAVDYARRATIRGSHAREFGVTCDIDFTKRYRVERRADDGAGVRVATEREEVE